MGPLEGVRIIELAGIGPAPMACMLLSDLGADVLRIDRPVPADLGVPGDPKKEVLNRGRRSAAVDLKNPEGVEVVLKLVERADVLIEGFRPGVTERMKLGPADCHARNPGLVYGRMTGWGQDGPLAQAAGHDLNYIALTGALHAIGPKDGRPVPPLNLVGDFGGGALYLVVGVLAALLERGRSGRGQVVDTAMVDGAASLMAVFYGLFGQGMWRDERGANLLDGAAHFYGTYETADGKHVSIAPIEGRFYDDLLKRIGLADADLPKQHDRKAWPELRAKLEAIFRTRTRDAWCELLEGTDACFAPVLALGEAPDHPHNKARGNFVDYEGLVQPAPAPRFDRTPGAIAGPPAAPGEHTDEALADWGLAEDEIARLRAAGAVA